MLSLFTTNMELEAKDSDYIRPKPWPLNGYLLPQSNHTVNLDPQLSAFADSEKPSQLPRDLSKRKRINDEQLLCSETDSPTAVKRQTSVKIEPITTPQQERITYYSKRPKRSRRNSSKSSKQPPLKLEENSDRFSATANSNQLPALPGYYLAQGISLYHRRQIQVALSYDRRFIQLQNQLSERLDAKKLIDIVCQIGGLDTLQAVNDSWEELIAFQLTAEDIVKIANHTNGYKNIKAILNSRESILNFEISIADAIGILNGEDGYQHLATYIQLVIDGLFLDEPDDSLIDPTLNYWPTRFSLFNENHSPSSLATDILEEADLIHRLG